MNPARILLFFLAVLVVLGVVGWLVPREGIKVGELFTLH